MVQTDHETFETERNHQLVTKLAPFQATLTAKQSKPASAVAEQSIGQTNSSLKLGVDTLRDGHKVGVYCHETA
jgi:hypothetical protein